MEATLTQTPSATLQPLLNLQAQYGATLTNNSADAPFLQNHNSITAYLTSLTGEDEIKAAKFYKTNKAIFDAVYLTNYDVIQGKNPSQTQEDFDFQLYRSLILKHKLAVAVTVIAGTLAATPPYELIETSITTAVALAGIYKAKDFHMQIVTDVFRVIEVELNDVLGDNARVANKKSTPLSLSDNQAVTMPFTVNAKTLNNADNGIQKEFVQKYFTSKNSLNDFIDQLNSAIIWINSNISFANLSTIPTIEVPNTSTSNSFNTNTQLMSHFIFSVNHPNLSLETATLSSTGLLNLKVKFIGSPTTVPINSTLNYTYNDDFSSFSGSFPIEVEAEQQLISLVGNWAIVGYGSGAYDPTTDLYSSYITSETFTNTCVGLNVYDGNHTTSYIFSNNVVFTANGFSMSYSRQTSGQFCDASFGEFQCNYLNNYSYTSTLASSPTIQLNSLKPFNSNSVKQVNEMCSPGYDNNGEQICTTVGNPYCEGSTLNETYTNNTNIWINIKDDEDTIYINEGGKQFKLVRQ